MGADIQILSGVFAPRRLHPPCVGHPASIRRSHSLRPWWASAGKQRETWIMSTRTMLFSIFFKKQKQIPVSPYDVTSIVIFAMPVTKAGLKIHLKE